MQFTKSKLFYKVCKNLYLIQNSLFLEAFLKEKLKVQLATEHFESKTWILIDFFTRPLSSISFNKFLLKYFYFWSQCTKISFIHREKRYKVLLVNRLHYILEGHRFDKLWQNCETQVSQLHLTPERRHLLKKDTW